MQKFKDALIDYIKQHENFIEDVVIDEIVIGLSYAGVLLNDNSLGVTSVDASSHKYGKPMTCINSRAGTYQELDLIELIELINSPNRIERIIGYTTINAISQSHFRRSEIFQQKIVYETDVVDCVKDFQGEPVLMIGNIIPIKNALQNLSYEVYIKDRNQDLELKNEDWDVFQPGIGILILSASSISNESIVTELLSGKSFKKRILLGPSGQIFPEFLFKETNLDYVGSMTFIKPNEALRVIKQGGGTRSFQKYAKKYFISH